MKIIRIAFIETAGMDAPVIRPYTTSLKKEHTDLFALDTDQGRRITPDRLSKTVSQLVGPSTKHKHRSFIDNGWGEKRIMFAMVVEIADRGGSKTFQYIVGYTDKSDIAKRLGKTVKFDDEMRMYFNTITKVHMIQSSWKGSAIWQPRMQLHDQVLRRSSLTGDTSNRANNRPGDKPVTLRPTDLFRRGGSEAAFGAHLRSTGDVTNMTGAFSTQLRASSRANNSATQMLSRSLKAVAAASSNPNSAYLGDNDDEETLEMAQDKVQESLIEQDPFIEEAKKVSNILSSGYITFGELMDMNPDFDEDRQLGFKEYKPNQSRFNANANFNEDTNETVAATIISNSLPGIMISSMYSAVENMILKSHPRQGESCLVFAKPSPFVPGMEIESTFDYFEDQVVGVMMNEISHGGVFDIEATIDANIDTEIQITIRIDGGEECRYVFPTFADGLLAPTMDMSLHAVDVLSKGVIKLATGLNEARMAASPNHSEEGGISLSSDVRRERARSEEARPSRDHREAVPRAANRPRGGATKF